MGITLLLLNILPMVLQAIPGISGKLMQIIDDVASGTSSLLKSGALTHPTASTILASWVGVISALQNDPALPPASFGVLAELGKAVQAALLQDDLAARSVDWSLIRRIDLVPVVSVTPIAPVPAHN